MSKSSIPSEPSPNNQIVVLFRVFSTLIFSKSTFFYSSNFLCHLCHFIEKRNKCNLFTGNNFIQIKQSSSELKIEQYVNRLPLLQLSYTTFPNSMFTLQLKKPPHMSSRELVHLCEKAHYSITLVGVICVHLPKKNKIISC